MRSLSFTTRLLFTVMAMLSPAAANTGFAHEVARTCPDGTAPRADLGIRIRFIAGDFINEEGRPRWIQFLSEPVVNDVRATGPSAGRLLPGDIIVAVGGDLITTRMGSFRFFFSHGDSLRIAILREGRPMVRWIRPLQECVRIHRS